MSREIKFRAYHKERKEIFEIASIDFEEKKAALMNGIIKLLNVDFKQFELLQYTGLKDKNGKEIYEGDIIICKYGPQIAMEVKWIDEGFRTLVKYDGDNYVGFVKESAEVIGNIYENKNLLEVKE
jgi:hypothetical protein